MNGTCLNIAEHEGHFDLIEFLRGWEATHRRIGDEDPVLSPSDNSKWCNPLHSQGSHPSAAVASISYNKKLIEAAEIMGVEPAVSIACLYSIQARGEPTDQLDILMAEVNKQKVQTRECSICLSNQVDSLCLPCRHSAICMECSSLVMSHTRVCPICRETIKEVIQIYIS